MEGMEGMEAVAHKTPALKQQRDRLQKRGFSLIEAAFVLAVVGAVIGTIWVAAAKFYEDYKVNKTVNDVALIVKNLQGLISIRDSEEMSMQGLTDLTPTLIAAGVYPNDWVNGNIIKNPFGGTSYARNYTNPNRFDLYLTGLSKPVCRKLLVRLSAMSAMTMGVQGISSINIGYIAVTNGGGWDPYTSFPVSPETAAGTCNNINNLPRSIIIDAAFTRRN